jgi:hypothetical protein
MQARTRALELVGPLLHPVSRSETWRRLVIPAIALCARSLGFISKRDVPAPGAGLKTELRDLADVPRLREADRKTGGNRLQNYNINIVPDRIKKPKEKARQ